MGSCAVSLVGALPVAVKFMPRRARARTHAHLGAAISLHEFRVHGDAHLITESAADYEPGIYQAIAPEKAAQQQGIMGAGCTQFSQAWRQREASRGCAAAPRTSSGLVV